MKGITQRHPSGDNTTGGKTKRIATCVLQKIKTLWLLGTNQAIIASRKLKDYSKISPITQRPKKLIASINNKAIKLRHRNRRTGNLKDDDGANLLDDGLWQREILMGYKCQPLNFPGVIYYDRDGKRTEEFPMRSPRASPFSSHVPKFDCMGTST